MVSGFQIPQPNVQQVGEPGEKVTMELHFLLQVERISKAGERMDMPGMINLIQLFHAELEPYSDQQFEQDIKGLEKWQAEAELMIKGECQDSFGHLDQGNYDEQMDLINLQYYYKLYGLLNKLLLRSGWVESSVNHIEFSLKDALLERLCPSCKGVVSPEENPFLQKDKGDDQPEG